MSFISEPSFGFYAADVEDILLRDYQQESVEQLRANIRAKHWAQILASFVGSGKTVMGAFLLRECWRNGHGGIFCVDRESLLGQTSRMFDKYGIPHGVYQGGHARYKPGEKIQIAMIQTIARRRWPDAKLIIYDEAHDVHKPVVKRITEGGGIHIGLTATPFTKGLGRHYSAIVNVRTGNQLTEDGVLVPFRVWNAISPDMDGAEIKCGEWTDKAAVDASMKIVGSLVEQYQLHGENRKFICFGVDVATCEAYQREFLSAGIKVALYTYRTGDLERDMLIGERGEFRKPDSEIRGLLSVAALSRGFDVPDVEAIIECRPLKNSFSQFVQILGRGLRSHPEKKNCHVIDHAGNFMRHRDRLMEFMEDGVNSLCDGKPKPKNTSVPKERKTVKCPKCGYLPCGEFCASCGYIFPKKTVIHEAGQFAEMDLLKAPKLDRAAKTVLYGELAYIANLKGWSENRMRVVYKNIAGTFPNGITSLPILPSNETLRRVDADQETYRKRIRQSYAREHAMARRAKPSHRARAIRLKCHGTYPTSS